MNEESEVEVIDGIIERLDDLMNMMELAEIHGQDCIFTVEDKKAPLILQDGIHMVSTDLVRTVGGYLRYRYEPRGGDSWVLMDGRKTLPCLGEGGIIKMEVFDSASRRLISFDFRDWKVSFINF